MKHDINFYPYKLQIKQTLTNSDKEKRFELAHGLMKWWKMINSEPT